MGNLIADTNVLDHFVGINPLSSMHNICMLVAFDRGFGTLVVEMLSL